MNSFVGSSRHEALMLLEGAYSEVIQTRVPQVALLTGMPGSGKTRLIQEFFSILGHQQRSTAYWPKSIIGDSKRDDLLKFRYKINPDRVNDSKARRNFSWFAQVCQRSVENPDLDIRSLTEALQQFQNLHTERRHQVFQKVVAGLLVVAAIVVEFLDNYLSLSDPLKLVARSAGLTSLILGVFQQTQSFVELRRRRIRAMGGSSQLRADSLAGSVEAIKHEVEKAGCPTVVVIDDWHAASNSTVQFVSECLELRGPCFIILTRWLGGFVGSDVGDPAKQIEGLAIVNVQLEELSPTDLRQFLNDTTPNMSEMLRSKIAERADGNPLLCFQIARMPHVTAIDSKNLTSDQIDQKLNEIPFDPEGVGKEQWRQLPVDVQRYLCTASVFGELIPIPVVRGAFSKYFAGDADAVLSRARDEFFWLQVFQSDVDRFPDGMLYKIARNEAKSILGEHEVNELTHFAAGLSDTDLPEPLRTSGILGQIAGDQRLALRLKVGRRSQTLEDMQLVYQQVITMPAGSRFASQRLELCRAQIDWIESQTDSDPNNSQLNDYLIQFKYFEFKSVGQQDPQEGLDLGFELLKIIGTNGLKEDLILRLGNFHTDLGEYEVAAEYYNQLIANRQSHVFEDAWANLQVCRVRMGEIEGAIASARRRLFVWQLRWVSYFFMRGLVPSIRLKFQSVTEDISLLRRNVGGWYCIKGDLKRGIRYQRSAIRFLKRIPHRVWIREAFWKMHESLGYWYLKSGQFEQASETLSSILREDRYRSVLPADSPHHMRARLWLVVALSCLSKHEEARAELVSIDEDSETLALGPEKNQWLYALVTAHFDQPSAIVEAI